jgi:AraC-like DNA-binding protein
MDPHTQIAELIERFTGQDGMHDTPLPRLKLARFSTPSVPFHGMCEPSFCVIVQGKKRVILNDEIYVYDSSRYLVASVDLPVTGQVIEATEEKPYLSLRFILDPREIASLILQADLHASSAPAPTRGIFVGEATPPIQDAVLRLLRLLESPADIPALGPLAEREVLYRLMRGEHGARIAQMATSHSHSGRVTKAITWLRTHFAEPLRIEDFAREANMSTSSLHQHFKAVTAMSPLQFQKHLRLQEARRLLLAEDMDAATAAHSVGYESPSQFSREYSRLFGAPPLRDVQRLREMGMANAVA